MIRDASKEGRRGKEGVLDLRFDIDVGLLSFSWALLDYRIGRIEMGKEIKRVRVLVRNSNAAVSVGPLV